MLRLRGAGRSNFDKGLHNLSTLIKKRHILMRTAVLYIYTHIAKLLYELRSRVVCYTKIKLIPHVLCFCYNLCCASYDASIIIYIYVYIYIFKGKFLSSMNKKLTAIQRCKIYQLYSSGLWLLQQLVLVLSSG